MDGTKPHFTSTLVVTLHESNAWSVFETLVRLHATCVCIRMGPHWRDELNAKDTDVEKIVFFM